MEVWRCAVRELCGMPALLWLALQDRKHMGVPCVGLGICVAVLLIGGSFGAVSLQSRMGGALFGGLLLMFAFFSKEAIGQGDAILLCVCGVAFGLYETVTSSFFAALYAGGYAALLLVKKQAGRKSRIPFLPFFLLGYITMRLIWRFS